MASRPWPIGEVLALFFVCLFSQYSCVQKLFFFVTETDWTLIHLPFLTPEENKSYLIRLSFFLISIVIWYYNALLCLYILYIYLYIYIYCAYIYIYKYTIKLIVLMCTCTIYKYIDRYIDIYISISHVISTGRSFH